MKVSGGCLTAVKLRWYREVKFALCVHATQGDFSYSGPGKEGLSMSFGELALKIGMLLVFFGVMIYVGFYCRKHSTDVNGFVLGGQEDSDTDLKRLRN